MTAQIAIYFLWAFLRRCNDFNSTDYTGLNLFPPINNKTNRQRRADIYLGKLSMCCLNATLMSLLNSISLNMPSNLDVKPERKKWGLLILELLLIVKFEKSVNQIDQALPNYN